MSVQIFLLGKLSGLEEFLLSPAGGENSVSGAGPAPEEGNGLNEAAILAGRAQWAALLTEVLPRGILAELGLSPLLLGTSGGGQFLIVLPEEFRPRAEELLSSAKAGIYARSASRLQLVWAWTENLGDWSLVRKRLYSGLNRALGTPLAVPLPALGTEQDFSSFCETFREAPSASWSPEEPGTVSVDSGKYTWRLGPGPDDIHLARHTALNDDGTQPATPAELASRADGSRRWGVLRGDVDNFGVRLRSCADIEEHLRLSRLMKQFFAGEIELACNALPELWRKVTILYTGGDDFAVYGSWDALLRLAREFHRLFHLFADEALKHLDGPEAKTISMALALAPDQGTPFPYVYEEAGRLLDNAKSEDKDCIQVFGRTVDWKQVHRAADLRESLIRLVRDFRCPPGFLTEFTGFYREKPHAATPTESRAPGGRPWRYHRRIGLALGSRSGREFDKLRHSITQEMIGGSAQHVRLRPAGRVAVEWARLSIEAETNV